MVPPPSVNTERRPRALVVGAMILDILAIASRKAKAEDSTPGQVTTSAGGVALNIAEGLARLSVDTSLVSIVGDDDAARQLLMHCDAAGINTSPVVRRSGVRTSSYVSLHDLDGSLLYAVADAGLIETFSAHLMPSLLELLSDTDVCIIDANLPVEFITWLVSNKGNVPLVAEAVSINKCQKLLSILPSLQLLKVNCHEAEALANLDSGADLHQIAESLLSCGLENVLITLGAAGAMLATMQGSRLHTHYCEAPEVDIKSVNGAGDAFLAGLLSADLHGEDAAEQLRWGRVAAGSSLGVNSACSPDINLGSMEPIKSNE